MLLYFPLNYFAMCHDIVDPKINIRVELVMFSSYLHWSFKIKYSEQNVPQILFIEKVIYGTKLIHDRFNFVLYCSKL